MTIHEGCVLSAYTGHLLTDFSSFHKYVEIKLGRPVFTHELGMGLFDELKPLVKEEFESIIKNQTE